MKKILLSVFLLLFLPAMGFALQASTFLNVTRGELETEGIIAEKSGKIFVEFLPQTLIRHKSSLQNFEGSMVAPEIIDLPATKPQSLMRTIFVFSLRGNSESVLTFQIGIIGPMTKIEKKK